ncbi:MAG: EAL domain-containing protein [Limnospira sp. PMC 1291.21]|uniref:EAL domain-containing protein n=1 Tax=Limnospira fusiformis PMC 851.14 TaxID=2219512 RepID=A0ABU9EFG5_LIMFS|nr:MULTISPECIES: GGDEF domain-containing response regulator [Limnospira]QJB27393.1 EAL domain-containing protein [Limnospira fusiformis SAG 85.79]MDT9178214.1 EAL domain-containing protein [Limnospira sp. PMC 1238.20]MDT9194242.1 EAL domain-containing protein [Limnospira sp. PMC 1245.20]MDT9198272.1 EAL domain-containing protein [Limnospira sp. PMC 1042.18]MDT9204533.1 EAL domain-containing protein [Limnospira sp. PMC 1243.20]
MSYKQSNNHQESDILIVDDTPGNLHLLSRILRKKGYQVREAIDGKTALEEVNNKLPDLILLDIMMPDIDGYTVCNQLKSDPNTAEVPIIFLSALDDIFDKVKAFESGGVDYISKPFQFQEVLIRVKNQLTLRRTQQQLQILNTQLEARVEQRTKELEIANSKLRDMAFRDELTNLPNRALFLERLADGIDIKQQYPNYQFVVLLLDCDRFKMINESLGHSVGDQLLVAISKRLKSLLKPEDTLARLGGDEFAIMVNKIEDMAEAKTIAQKVLDSFSHPFVLPNQEVFINVSIGISLSHLDYQKPEHILRDADTAMYRAKDLGKGQYHIFDPSMHHHVSEKLQLENDLRRAITNNEFLVYYQPIIHLKTGKIAGFEALIRWQHPTKKLIPPVLFIPIAEETGLINAIGYLVLKSACEQFRSWQENKLINDSMFISVNVSARQFANMELSQQIQQILEATKLDPHCLKLEITESAIMDNPKTAVAILEGFKSQNVRLSIDDFGTGYSSLSYLHNFQVDTLKIDKSFVQRMDNNGSSCGLVPVIVNIAKTMKMGVIAEGVETPEQLSLLRSLECEFAQGYLFSPPLPESSLLDLISGNLTW